MKDNLMVRLMTAMILIGIALAHLSGQTDLMALNWLWLAVFAAIMGFQATFTGWCPAELVGKLSKTGKCCPGGACGTTAKVEPENAERCCSSTNQGEECCGSEKPAASEKDKSCCSGQQVASDSNCCSTNELEIKVLGTGCTTCTNTVKLIETTALETGISVKVTKVEDIAEIAAYGVMSTPAIVIKEQVVHSGSMPNKKMIIEWLS